MIQYIADGENCKRAMHEMTRFDLSVADLPCKIKAVKRKSGYQDKD